MEFIKKTRKIEIKTRAFTTWKKLGWGMVKGKQIDRIFETFSNRLNSNFLWPWPKMFSSSMICKTMKHSNNTEKSKDIIIYIRKCYICIYHIHMYTYIYIYIHIDGGWLTTANNHDIVFDVSSFIFLLIYI